MSEDIFHEHCIILIEKGITDFKPIESFSVSKGKALGCIGINCTNIITNVISKYSVFNI